MCKILEEAVSMKRKAIITIVALALVALGTGEINAQRFRGRDDRRGPGEHRYMRERPGPRGMFFGNPERMKQELGLSDKQIDRIGKINLEYKKRFLEYREKLEPKRISLKKLLLEDEVNLQSVRSLLMEIAKIRVDIRMLRIEHRLDIEKVLTTSQKTKFRNFRLRRFKPHPGRVDDF
jgi:Spy/CpxP family protein refolding chaperone